MHDYEEPTEPMSRVFLPPYSAPTFQTEITPDWNAIPVPQFDEVPFPRSRLNPEDAPAIAPMQPFLSPATPDGHSGGPAEIVPPEMYAGNPETFKKPKKRRSWLPSLAGLFFLAVEFLLLLRLLFALFGTPVNQAWVGFVYTVSTFFLLPFYLVLQNVRIPVINGTAFYADLIIVGAIFVYGIASRIVLRFLKFLTLSR